MEIMLKDVRLSFPDLGEPQRYQDNPSNAPRWGATLLVPEDSAQRKLVDKAVRDVLTEKFGAKCKATSKKTAQQVLDDLIDEILADKKASAWVDGNKKPYDGYDGNMALTAYRYADKGRPIVMDNDMSPIYAADNTLMPGKGGRIYGGCYVNAKVEIWAQDNKNGKGVRATLMAIQRNRAGDAFGGGAAPSATGFEEVGEGADADDLSE